ncbi:unnamed protein product, partial [Rotaria sp. Silwood1]
MFNDMTETSSSTGMSRKTTKSSKKLRFNKDTWKIFIKFLTMNNEFYEYTTLDIDAHDNLLDDRYTIRTRLGNAKISKKCSYSKFFLNEYKIAQQLKEFIDLNESNKFFQDIPYLSPL